MLHLGVVDEAGLLKDGAAAGEDDEIGDAADLKAGGELGVGFGIDFKDQGFTCHVGGSTGDFRGGGAAGAAPVGPEVDKDGDGRVLDDLVEEGGVSGQRFGERRERGLAGAAFAGVAEVPGGDAVLFLTVGAGADHGHGDDLAGLLGFGCDRGVERSGAARARGTRWGHNRGGTPFSHNYLCSHTAFTWVRKTGGARKCTAGRLKARRIGFSRRHDHEPDRFLPVARAARC
jgi:hypothetical protein